jgi:hypothetical protein
MVVDDRPVSLSQRRFIMEPHREEQNRAPPPSAEPKPNRFRIVKLEERIVPSSGGGTNGRACRYSGNHTACCGW